MLEGYERVAAWESPYRTDARVTVAEHDPYATQRDVGVDLAAELADAGFDDAREIGRGGFGVVYRCYETALDRPVAVKVLTSHMDPDNLERFLREQRAMGRLSGHPNIVNVMQVGTTRTGRPYLVMQYHSRDSLDAQLRSAGPVPWPEVLRIGIKLAGALETGHRAGILHRDIKPGNILLTEFGEPQLTDFGIARVSGGFETATGEVTGSPAFTAPEVLSGRAPTPASDVYSLGATLFCVLTGHAAFERRSGERVVAQFVRVTTQPVPDLRERGIPDALSSAIERAMSVDPQTRPASAAEFGEMLREVQADEGLPVDELPVAGELEPGSESGHHPSPSVAERRGTYRSGVRATTPPAPATRFRPPSTPRRLVPRRRLLSILDADQRRKLTAIHSPPGFGKTMLALQWRYVLTGKDVPVAWLNVDHDDNNVVWFLTHLVESIRQVRPSLARELGQVLDEHGDEAERYVLTSLVDEIHEAGERLVVIIDDWHRVTDPATVAAMAFLLDNACHHLQLVVVGRTRSGLPTSRMRVRDELVEIDYEQLRFDVDEARVFLVDLAGLDLDDDEVADLTAATDGWAAALQLAAMSLRGRDDPEELISHLSGRHRAIGEFLAENVLASLPPADVEFLLASSITERICGSLATALTGHERGQALLESIEERDLFLHRIDEDGRWFRYQPLFAEFLRQRFEREHPERIPALHRTASEWFESHAMVGEAVDHALAAGDEDRATDLVEENGRRLLEHGHATTLLGLVAKLPRRAASGRIHLQLSIAWANILLHRSAPALRALEVVEAAVADSGTDAEEAADIAVEVEVVRGVVDLRCDRMERADDLVEHCLARADTLPPLVIASGLNVATFAAVYRADYDEVVRLQQLAQPYHDLNEGPYNLMHGRALLGLAAIEQLDVAGAEEHFRAGLRAARRGAGRHSSAAMLAGSILGELLYERGELDEAERLLDDGYALGSEGGVVDFKISRYVVGARLKAVRGDRDAVVSRLADGGRAAAVMDLERLAAVVENERVRLGLGPLPGVASQPPVSYGTRPRPDHGTAAWTAQFEEATAIRLLLADPTPENTELACRWAGEWVQLLRGSRRERRLLRAERLEVACLAAAGRHEEAVTLLASVAARCERAGLHRFLPDGGPLVLDVARRLADELTAGRGRAGRPDVSPAFLHEAVDTGAVHLL
ncbi:Serine/threonine-protein kinase PknK [Rhodococcus ruber]